MQVDMKLGLIYKSPRFMGCVKVFNEGLLVIDEILTFFIRLSAHI